MVCQTRTRKIYLHFTISPSCAVSNVVICQPVSISIPFSPDRIADPLNDRESETKWVVKILCMSM